MGEGEEERVALGLQPAKDDAGEVREMKVHSSFVYIGVGCLALLLASGCGNREPEKARSPEKKATEAPKQAAAPFVPVDACSLLTKAEVEELSGKPVEEPQKEVAGNLTTCSYGDPKSPQVGNRRLSKVVGTSVFTGQEGSYYAGAVAQAKDTYEMARKNSASDEAVSGLGESAYWDKTFRTLNVYKDKYFVGVTVESEGGMDLAKKLMAKALTRLP